MKTYSVKEIAKMLETNPETVRRWIRDGKLRADISSKKEGHVIYESELKEFFKTAPKYAGLDKVNPSSVILSGEMMLRHLKWDEAADLIIHAMEKTIASKVVTYDFARLMEGATKVKCSEFASELIKNL